MQAKKGIQKRKNHIVRTRPHEATSPDVTGSCVVRGGSWRLKLGQLCFGQWSAETLVLLGIVCEQNSLDGNIYPWKGGFSKDTEEWPKGRRGLWRAVGPEPRREESLVEECNQQCHRLPRSQIRDVYWFQRYGGYVTILYNKDVMFKLTLTLSQDGCAPRGGGFP